MANAGLPEYRSKLFGYYEERRYSEALELAKEAARKFPDYEAKTSFWIACLQSRLGDYDEAIQTLQSAIERGVWWLAATLQDSDLDSIRDRLEFKMVMEESRLLQKQAPKLAKPELVVRVPIGYSQASQWPALIVFHQRYGERPELSAEQWIPVTSTGTILAAPWSSQVYSSDGRCWDDLEMAEKDVKWTIKELGKRYRLDPARLIVGGFSQGGALSIYSALKRLFPCAGFVAVAPSDWVRPEERPATERKGLSKRFVSVVKASDCRGLRGVIIAGDKDPFFSKVKKLYALMVERGLNGKLVVESELGHEYPDRFEMKLNEAVEFVRQGSPGFYEPPRFESAMTCRKDIEEKLESEGG